MKKVKSQKEILKFNLDVDNVGGLGVKRTKKEGKKGAKFA